jgi:hypothetical protein
LFIHGWLAGNTGTPDVTRGPVWGGSFPRSNSHLARAIICGLIVFCPLIVFEVMVTTR